jgi:hypothetical protein
MSGEGPAVFVEQQVAVVSRVVRRPRELLETGGIPDFSGAHLVAVGHRRDQQGAREKASRKPWITRHGGPPVDNPAHAVVAWDRRILMLTRVYVYTFKVKLYVGGKCPHRGSEGAGQWMVINATLDRPLTLFTSSLVLSAK